MTDGERIAATTSWRTNRAELARIIDAAIANHDAQLEARARLEEAKWWDGEPHIYTRHGHTGPSHTCRFCKRIVLLEAQLQALVSPVSKESDVEKTR